MSQDNEVTKRIQNAGGTLRCPLCGSVEFTPNTDRLGLIKLTDKNSPTGDNATPLKIISCNNCSHVLSFRW